MLGNRDRNRRLSCGRFFSAFSLGILLAAGVGFAESETAARPGYAARMSFELSQARDGLNGRLELLEDSGILPSARADHRWDRHPPGILRVVDGSGLERSVLVTV